MNAAIHANAFVVTVTRLQDVARRHRGLVIAIIVVVAVGIVVVMMLFSRDNVPSPRQVRELTVVTIVPPPPPPPPPPPQQKVPEQQMIEQPKMVEPEIKEDKPVDQPKPDASRDDAPPPGPLALDAKGDGPGDSFGLGGNPGGRGLLGGGGGGSRWGWYASMVQQQIEAAIRANAKTRNAVMTIRVRLWADETGRISRVQLASSTGDAEVDAVLRDQVFPGLSLREPPPKDMPMPMVTRITARRPN
jgi:periplasmic protein TonB